MPCKIYDGQGLYLIVNPNGSKWRRFKYSHAGNAKTISLGVYPATTLKQASKQSDLARKQLADGLDPSFIRKQEKERALIEARKEKSLFKFIAEEWLAKNMGQ